jgi:hypothetical protein
MARRYIAANRDTVTKFFGESRDFTANDRWWKEFMKAVDIVAKDSLFSCRPRGNNTFNIVTMGNKKLTLFVRYGSEDRTICVGVEEGGKKGFGTALKEMFDLAYERMMNAPVHPMPTRPCPTDGKYHICQANFQGDEYGAGYLTFASGDHLEMFNAPSESAGWMYGQHIESGVIGWFPPSYIR